MARGPKVKVDRGVLYQKIDIERALAFFEKIIFSEEYQDLFIRRAKSGVLAPALEMMMWHYCFGKPQDTINVNVKTETQQEVTKLTDEELAERARKLSERLRTPKSLPPPVTPDPERLN